MDAWRKSLLFRNSGQQAGQRFLFFGVKRGAQRVLMFARDSANGFEPLFSPGGKVQGIGTPVAGAGFSFEQAGPFHFVEHQDQSAGKHAEKPCQCLLADSRPRIDGAQDSGVGGREF